MTKFEMNRVYNSVIEIEKVTGHTAPTNGIGLKYYIVIYLHDDEIFTIKLQEQKEHMIDLDLLKELIK